MQGTAGLYDTGVAGPAREVLAPPPAHLSALTDACATPILLITISAVLLALVGEVTPLGLGKPGDPVVGPTFESGVFAADVFL